ncbi:MAG: HAMP domain-containing histidine kinase [Deltaproteobacteria bacterium]|nr:HAMP domain-containing histidine kinase [Deltaproteobacteria bacterium]
MTRETGVDSVRGSHHRVVNHFFHDFHGEISTIIMCIGAVRDGIGGEISPPQRETLERAIDNCEQMVRLINNYRDRTQMEEGTYPRVPEEVDLSEAMRQLAVATQPFARERNVKLEIRGDGLPKVRFRAALLGRVLENLLLQVIENTPARAGVEVQARIAERKLEVRVRFEGEELDEEQAPSVFDPVRQATLGLRLGRGYTLLFCKEAISYLGGDIRITPWKGRGNELVARVAFEEQGGNETAEATDATR